MKKINIKRILNISAFVLILCSVIVICVKDKLKTEFAQSISYNNIVTADGFVARDEKIIEMPQNFNKNCMFFMQTAGERVAKNASIAKIYDSPKSLEIVQKINNISQELDFIKKMSMQASKSNESINELNPKINENISKILISDMNFDYIEHKKLKNILWYLLNKKQIMLDKTNYIDKKISKLSDELDSLNKFNAQEIYSIKSDYNGVFANFTDGYEFEFDNNLNELLEKININKTEYPNNVIGKIVKSNVWYAVLDLDVNDVDKLSENMTVKVSVDGYMNEILCKIERKINNKIIISCDYMNKNLVLLRKNNFKLNLGEYNGIKINKSALRKKDESPDSPWGVFVKRGKYLRFKKINIVFSDKNFIICDYGPKYYSDENYVQNGDKIVINGKNLYENKKI